VGQIHAEIAQNLAERLYWQAARRDDSRVARRLYGQQVVDSIYRLDEGALLDDFFSLPAAARCGSLAGRHLGHGDSA
jgi:hypothetical protein